MPAQHTLVDLLGQQAERYRDKVAFSFSYNGDDQNPARLTYHELDLQVRTLASHLQEQGAGGQQVLVFCRPGLDGIVGYFGCLYAGAVAVPVHQKLAPRLSSVVPDARATFAVGASATRANIGGAVDLLNGQAVQWFATDEISGDPSRWVPPDIDADTTAMVQYTSGSTHAPAGVVLTHRNLLHQVAAIHQAWRGDDNDTCVFWLPQHHDMGLIGGILHSVHLGCTTYLMSPSAFIQRPMRWLEMISRHHGVLTAAPNFAYDLCVEHSTPAERAAIDLSRLTVAMNGAEPVRAATLRAFADAFAPAGFRLAAFMPVYGLAEATLLVSGGSDSATPVVQYLDREALSTGRVAEAAPDDPATVELVSCGRPQGGQDVVIVDPETHRRRGPDEVGEIWIAGPSIARGYRGRPHETEQTFGAVLAETGQGPFLRTGDLGFLQAGELFVTGRVKDLIVLGGRNYYPNDIETTVQDCHPALLRGRGAVFLVAAASGRPEQLVVVQELDRRRAGDDGLTDLITAVRSAITEHHRVQADVVLLVEPMRIPTTSSGKIQRGSCRERYLGGDLDATVEWYAALPSDDAAKAKNRAAAIKAATLIQAAAALRAQQAGPG